MKVQKLSIYLLMLLMISGISCLRAQSIAVKTNLAGWTMLMPNAGIELIVNERSSWDVSLYQSVSDGWLCDVNATAVQIGYKYWFDLQPLDHFFIGATATSAHYKALVNDINRRGVAIPTGVNIGYAWPLGRRWNLELSYGMGVTWLSEEVSTESETYRRHHASYSPTNIGINISYLLR